MRKIANALAIAHALIAVWMLYVGHYWGSLGMFDLMGISVALLVGNVLACIYWRSFRRDFWRMR